MRGLYFIIFSISDTLTNSIQGRGEGAEGGGAYMVHKSTGACPQEVKRWVNERGVTSTEETSYYMDSVRDLFSCATLKEYTER